MAHKAIDGPVARKDSVRSNTGSGIDFADMLAPPAEPMRGSNQERAREALVKLNELRGLIADTGFTDLKGYLAQIFGAVKQVAEGKIDYVNYGVAERITSYQALVRAKIIDYAFGLTCTADVIAVREVLRKLEAGFPVLDRISEELVDYGPESK